MSLRLPGRAPIQLTMLEWPDDASQANRTVTERCRIGRRHSPPLQSDWLLADTGQTLSRLHCELTVIDGAWWLIDHSKHGTFLNEERAPIQQGRQELRDGDRIRLGAYSIEVRAGETAEEAAPWRQQPVQPWQRPVIDPPPPVPRAPAPWMDPPPIEPIADPGDKLPDDWWLEKDAARPAPPSPRPVRAPIEPPPIAQLPPRQEAEPGTDALLAAFLHGAGLRGFIPDDPLRTMEQLGAAMRALVAGLQQVRVSRAALKREFRIADSVFAPARLDNPLRDLLNEDEALRALLSGRFEPAAAIKDVLRRVRLHELALVAAMRDAAEDLVTALSPAKITTSTQAPPASGLLPDRRKARWWDAYEARHRQVAGALRDDFDSAFGKTFARAYERTVQQASNDAEPPRPGPQKDGNRR